MEGSHFQDKILRLTDAQKQGWELARTNYAGLAEVKQRTLCWDTSTEIKIQFNPVRIRSTGASVDARSISERACFLCQENRPEEQKYVVFENQYHVLVNPFPIFPEHLTIPSVEHTDQRIEGRFMDMLQLAVALPGFIIFYNGPRCGASAPDHFHFQAGNRGFMPVESEILTHPGKSLLFRDSEITVLTIENYLRKVLVLEGADRTSLERWFWKIFRSLENLQKEEVEPMFNVFCSFEGDFWRVYLFPRREHRPWQYYDQGNDKLLLSPGAVDFGGVLITPRQEDFEKLDNQLVADVFGQVTTGEEMWSEFLLQLI